MRVVISSGHSKHVRGAAGYLDEVDEARRVVTQVAGVLHNDGVGVVTFHDNNSTSQNQNLKTIVAAHNSHPADDRLDISVHLNAYVETSEPMGTETLFLSQGELAAEVSAAIAKAGDLIDRGPKKRTDLYFLNHTNGSRGAILIEVCFVDSEADADNYRKHFMSICAAIARCVAGHFEVSEE
jgi:N-acetylmuramoyl-L-alanine amidase